MNSKEVKHYLLIGITLILAYLGYLIIKPYITAILSAAILALIFYPMYKILLKATKRKTLSSILTCLIVVLIIIVPLFFISKVIIEESVTIYRGDTIIQLTEYLDNYLGEQSPHITGAIDSTLQYLSTSASNFIITIPSKILDFLIAIYTLFFLLIYFKEIKGFLTRLIPFRNKTKIVKHITESTYSIIYGLFAVAVIEFIFASITLALLGIKSPIIWGLLIGFLALIPFIGPTIVWIPLAIVYYFRGTLFETIGIIIIGTIVSLTDTFLRPRIIGKKTETSPVIILIGLLGGLKLFGLIGLIAGPIILTLIIILIEEYVKNGN